MQTTTSPDAPVKQETRNNTMYLNNLWHILHLFVGFNAAFSFSSFIHHILFSVLCFLVFLVKVQYSSQL